ncbi:hypothetical protein [Klebsiella pneumoniae]|nr:hypothetical protein [Klebsiella pneumoniae]
MFGDGGSRSLETFLTASQGATILFLAMLINWQKR